MEATFSLQAHGRLPGNPFAVHRRRKVYVFAGADYRPNFSLLRYRQGFSSSSADSFLERLSPETRRRLIERYAPEQIGNHARLRSRAEIRILRNLLLRARIKVYALNAEPYLERLTDPDDYLILPAGRDRQLSFDNSPEGELRSARYELGDELGRTLAARWLAADSGNDVYYSEHAGMRALILVGGAMVSVSEAISDIAQNVSDLIASIPDMAHVVMEVAGDTVRAVRETLTEMAQADLETVANALRQFGHDAVATGAQLWEQVKAGAAALHDLLTDRPTQRILADYLRGYMQSVGRVDRVTGFTRFTVTIGVEVLLALGAILLAGPAGAAAVVVAGRARMVGQFSMRALGKLFDVQRAVRNRNRLTQERTRAERASADAQSRQVRDPGPDAAVNDTPNRRQSSGADDHSSDGGAGGTSANRQQRNRRDEDTAPSDCDPHKSTDARGARARSNRPVVYATGEELLLHTDFEVPGLVPVTWTRAYRSSHAWYDQGPLGARWTTPYTTAFTDTGRDLIYHEETGRNVYLPCLLPGQEHHDPFERLTLVRDSADVILLTHPNGDTDVFRRVPAPRSGAAERFQLSEIQTLAGPVLSIRSGYEAGVPEAEFVITDQAGLRLECLGEPGRIRQVDQVFADGSRHTHVRYRYGAAAEGGVDLVAQYNAAGALRTYEYRHHLLTRYTDYNGFGQNLEWNGTGPRSRCLRTVADDGSEETRFEYDLKHRKTTVRHADGSCVVQYYDRRNLIVATEVTGADGRPQMFRRQWDDDGHLLAQIDPLGRVTRYDYDAAGNIARVTDPAGRVTQYLYDDNNRPVRIIDPAGGEWRRYYNPQGLLTRQIDPAEQVTGYEYDLQGRLIAERDAKGGVKRLTYNDAGQLTSFTDCSGHTTRFRYDRLGRLIESQDPTGQAVRIETDILGNVIAVAHPDGTREHFSYDESGNLCRYIDPNGASTEYRYNEQHQLIQRIDANRHALRYRYNRHRQLVQLINQNGETYDFRYDATGRLIHEIGFDGQETTYEYDPAGYVVARERGGLRTEYRRDPLGRLRQKTTPQGATHYAYDTLGRLTQARNEHARLNFEYDALGRLVTEEQHVAVPMGRDTRRVSFSLEHEYDVLGNRTQTRLPNGREVVTQRYGSGHWHGILWNGQAIVDVERDALHRETDRELGRGRERLHQSRDYDPLSRIKQLSLRRGDDTLAQRHFDYDAAGQLLEVRDRQRGTLSYRYDPVGQLLEAVQPGLKERFAFDPAGNLIEPGQGNAEKKLAPLQHNLLKKYLQQRYEHDERGNTVRKLRKGGPDEQPYPLTLHYDDENRLVQAERPVDGGRLQAEYYYDAFGRRVAKRVRTLAAARATGTDGTIGEQVLEETLTLFVWDGDTLIQEITDTGTITHLYEPESFVPLAQIHSDTPLAEYQTGPRGLSPTEPNRHQALKAAAATDRIYFVATDHLGTPQELVDEAGALAWQARYRAWGRIAHEDGTSIRQPLRFQGQYEDEETGLYYNRHRYYDPDSGRYVTPDPIGLLGGENAYQYAPNATGWVDPLGLCRGQPILQLAEAAVERGDIDGLDRIFSIDASISQTQMRRMKQKAQQNRQLIRAHTLDVSHAERDLYHSLSRPVGFDGALPRTRGQKLAESFRALFEFLGGGGGGDFYR